MKLLIIIMLFLQSFAFAQTDVNKQIDSLKFVTTMPYICEGGFDTNKYGCGDQLFWKVVILKENAIESLIEKLSDTTKTEAPVPLFGYTHTIADIAFVALNEIIHGIPTFELLGVEFDKKGCGYCSYWQHLNMNYNNRLNFKKAVQNWHQTNKSNLVWVINNHFSSCDCNGIHPNGGHYELKK